MSRVTNTDASRRALVAAASAAALLPWAGWAAPARTPVEVWKDPACGCCKEWVAHMMANGFDVKTHETGNNAVRAQLGIDRKYGSCHTAVVMGYALEGHVPSADVRRLLKERPQARGLAVPGMPVGTPGMDGSVYEGRRDAYEVLLLARDGTATVFSKYEGKRQGSKA